MPLLSTLPNEPYNIFFEMAPYIEICHAYSGRGGVPAKKFGLFVTAGGQTCGKVCRSIACPYSTSLCPYCQETKEQHSEMFRFGPQPTPCTVVVFGMFSGQRSTQGKGPSGEPRVWPRDGHWRHSRSKQRFSDGASTLFAMLGGRWLKYVEIE